MRCALALPQKYKPHPIPFQPFPRSRPITAGSARMLKLLQPTSRRTRLWQGGCAVALVVLTFVFGNAFVAPQRAVHIGLIGQDFLAFYTGGTFARQGRYAELYDID